jgi:hypothetical protein
MPFYPEGGDGTPQRQPFTLDDVVDLMNEMKGHGMAEFVVQWGDTEDSAVRTCGLHLPAAVRRLYDDNGSVYPVEVYLLNKGSQFPCEHYEHLPVAGEGGY